MLDSFARWTGAITVRRRFVAANKQPPECGFDGRMEYGILPLENLRQAMHTLFSASFERRESSIRHSSPEGLCDAQKYQGLTETTSIGGTVRPFSARL